MFITDKFKDRVEIPCDNIRETLAALKAVTHGELEQYTSPIRLLIQPIPNRMPPTGNCRGSPHSTLQCSECKKWPVAGFVYRCLQCPQDFVLCGECDTAGLHPEHVFLRFAQDDQVYVYILQVFSTRRTCSLVDRLPVFRKSSSV